MDIAKLKASKSIPIVDERNITFVLELFANTEREFTGEHAKTAAESAARDQVAIHGSLFDVIAPKVTSLPEGQRFSNEIAQFQQSYVRSSVTNAGFVIGIKGETYVVSSPRRFPVLIERDFSQLAVKIENENTPERRLDFIALFLAGYIAATRFGGSPVVELPTLYPRILAMQARMEAFVLLNGAPDGIGQAVRDVLGQSNEEASTAIGAAREKYASAATAIESDLAGLRERVQQATEAANIAGHKAVAFESKADELISIAESQIAVLTERFDGTEKQVKAFVEAIRTEANFEDLKIHWVDRGNKAWWALFWSGLVLFVLLVALPALAVFENGYVVSFIKGLTDAATVDVGDNPGPVTIAVATVSRLVVITIPLALYFWLIKLVVRFNMRSMLLMDDARQRATMLETYYRMIEKSAATKEDRALVLQALLRPAPGHGPDSVEPPNFTEVIDRAMGKGG